MSDTKWTPGSWFISRSSMGIHKYIEARIGGGMIQEIATCGPTEQHEQSDANAHLIAAAPELYQALEKACKETEHFQFEAWLVTESASGDCEEVHRKWLESSDYKDFVDEWSDQLDALAKARGES